MNSVENVAPTTALALQKPKDASGRFVKRTKHRAPTGQEITEYLRSYLQGRLEVSDCNRQVDEGLQNTHGENSG